MAEGSSMGIYVGVGVGASVILLMSLIAMLVMRNLKAKALKRKAENLRIVNTGSRTWFDPKYTKLVPGQVGTSDVHMEEGLLAVYTPGKRAMSVECLAQDRSNGLSPSNLQKSKQFSYSTQSLSSLVDENTHHNLDVPRKSLTLKNSPYVEFNLVWVANTSTMSVQVIRIVSLPPSYTNATCSYKVTLNKPDKTTISRSSNKVRKVNLNPDCLQVYSFPVSLEEVQKSSLSLEVYARKSKHISTKVIGQLHYQIPSNITPDTPIASTEPLTNYKKANSSAPSSPRGSISGSTESQWGRLEVLAQYQLTGAWQARIKLMIIKAQNNAPGKGEGSYKIEMIVKNKEVTHDVQETKPVQGPNPMWKTPFIFDVPQNKVQDYRVELNLVKTHRFRKSVTIGHAYLGLDTTATGTQHWEDLTAGPNKEITLWHPIAYPE